MNTQNDIYILSLSIHYYAIKKKEINNKSTQKFTMQTRHKNSQSKTDIKISNIVYGKNRFANVKCQDTYPLTIAPKF